MKIRKVSEKDLGSLVILFERYRTFHGQKPNKAAVERYLSERLNSKQSVIFVAEMQNDLKGFTQLYPSFTSVSLEEEWLLNDLFVKDEIRGQGTGVALLNAAQDFIKRNNNSSLGSNSESNHRLLSDK